MIIKVFNKVEEIEKYYDKKLSTYIFYEDEDLIDLVIFNFNLNVAANIIAKDIKALNINAWNIDACDISYWAVCFAYNSIKCKSITSKRENHKHFVLDGKLEVEEDEKED